MVGARGGSDGDEVEVPLLNEPVQGRSKLSTRRLLAAAGELVAERGFEQATLAAIGARAGYSRGLVAARFGTKENLFNALVDRITSEWVAVNVLPEIEGMSGLDGMLTFIDTVIDQLQSDAEALAVLWGLLFEALRSGSRLREQFVPFHLGVLEALEVFLRTGVDDGSIRPEVEPQIEARLCAAGLRGIAYHWLLCRDDDEVIDMLRAFRVQAEQLYRAG